MKNMGILLGVFFLSLSSNGQCEIDMVSSDLVDNNHGNRDQRSQKNNGEKDSHKHNNDDEDHHDHDNDHRHHHDDDRDHDDDNHHWYDF